MTTKKENTTWNMVREELNETLEAYSSIINIEESEELSHLGNDIITIIRDVYYNKNVKVEG